MARCGVILDAFCLFFEYTSRFCALFSIHYFTHATRRRAPKHLHTDFGKGKHAHQYFDVHSHDMIPQQIYSLMKELLPKHAFQDQNMHFKIAALEKGLAIYVEVLVFWPSG
mmetsp:Transcript_17973/g.28698  ORF Transcript_17973/g.28698 Transcript_17973/m.28698 type:complete len:111 (-) Transcript_17973:1102-1434(-)